MSNISKKRSGKILKSAAVFAAFVIIVQVVAFLLMTPEGLAEVYPYILAVKSEKIDTDDAGIGEYFPLHTEAEESGMIVLSVDTGVADSYVLAADFLVFLEKFTDVSAVVMYTANTILDRLSAASVSGDYETFESVCDSQKKIGAMPNQLFDFTEEVYQINETLPPDSKLPIYGIKGNTDYEDAISDIIADLYKADPVFSGDYSEVADAKDADEYTALFRKHEETLKNILGSKFERHEKRCAAIEAGVYEESEALWNLQKYVAVTDDVVFAVLPEHLCGEDSYFISEAEKIYGKVSVVDTVYYDCMTATRKGEDVRNDGKFPNLFSGIRIASADELAGFRSYFKTIVNSFDSSKLESRLDAVGDAGEKTFFIICDSYGVTYGIDENETAATTETSYGDITDVSA